MSAPWSMQLRAFARVALTRLSTAAECANTPRSSFRGTPFTGPSSKGCTTKQNRGSNDHNDDDKTCYLVESPYVQFGAAACAPATWRNFDISPTLRLQR